MGCSGRASVLWQLLTPATSPLAEIHCSLYETRLHPSAVRCPHHVGMLRSIAPVLLSHLVWMCPVPATRILSVFLRVSVPPCFQCQIRASLTRVAPPILGRRMAIEVLKWLLDAALVADLGHRTNHSPTWCSDGVGWLRKGWTQSEYLMNWKLSNSRF